MQQALIGLTIADAQSMPADSIASPNVDDPTLEDGVPGDLTDYLDEVGGQLEVIEEQARAITDVVNGSLRTLMSAEEVDAIAGALSPQLASMWSRAANVPGAPGHSGSP